MDRRIKHQRAIEGPLSPFPPRVEGVSESGENANQAAALRCGTCGSAQSRPRAGGLRIIRKLSAALGFSISFSKRTFRRCMQSSNERLDLRRSFLIGPRPLRNRPSRSTGENHSVMIASEKVMAPILIAKTSLGRLIALGVRFYNRSVIRQPAPPNPHHRDCHSLTSSTSIAPSPLQSFRSASFPLRLRLQSTFIFAVCKAWRAERFSSAATNSMGLPTPRSMSS